MDIEAIVTKYWVQWFSTPMAGEQCIRAALTELAAGYEQQLAIEQRACNKLAHDHGFLLAEREALQERIRQLEAERVPEGWKLVPTVLTQGMAEAYWLAYDEGSHLEVCYAAMLAAAEQPKKESGHD